MNQTEQASGRSVELSNKFFSLIDSEHPNKLTPQDLATILMALERTKAAIVESLEAMGVRVEISKDPTN